MRHVRVLSGAVRALHPYMATAPSVGQKRKVYQTTTTVVSAGGVQGSVTTTTTTMEPAAAPSLPAHLALATWNTAAIDNNPFEYWITHNDAAYNKLMDDVQLFIDEPGERDVRVDSVFTPEMFAELAAEMEKVGMEGVSTVATMWEAEYRGRTIIGGFMKDRTIGSKRLASMPDRMTNTINTLDEGAVCRPTIINCYGSDMDSVESWWRQWRSFVFGKTVLVKTKSGSEKREVWSLLQRIPRRKYPDISEEEEAVSIPLQLLCQAIFDATLVHMLNLVAPSKWYPLKMSICQSLNVNKQQLTLDIVSNHYAHIDALFMQEVAGVFVDHVSQRQALDRVFSVVVPEKLDGTRDQNSIILLSKRRWDISSVVEVTDQIFSALDPEEAKAVAPGDLFAISLRDLSGAEYLLVCYHGDTAGQASIPTIKAVVKVKDGSFPSSTLICGIDANTYDVGTKKLLALSDFTAAIEGMGLASCWGSPLNKEAAGCTTYNARTYLQPQLNKATKKADVVRFRRIVSIVAVRGWLPFTLADDVVVNACLSASTISTRHFGAKLMS